MRTHQAAFTVQAKIKNASLPRKFNSFLTILYQKIPKDFLNKKNRMFNPTNIN